MKHLSSPFAKAFFFAFGYGVLFYFIQFFLVRTAMFGVEPTAAHIATWDSAFYQEIAQQGYRADGDNTGFFILFPLIWRLSHLGTWGIVALNTIFFALGFAVLTRTLKEENRTFWLFWLTLPSVYFAFVPYTESIFFLLGTIILYALKTERFVLLWISLFLISLVRATGIFFLPAFIAAELLHRHARDWWKSLGLALIRYGIPMALGLALFVTWQYLETGIWFAYFKKQAEHWGHTFTWPSLPFTNIEYGALRYHWLSALALLIDAVALIFLLWQAVVWLKNKNRIGDRNLVFSCCYLAMVLFSILFMNPKYGGTTTNIMGANRYTIITPFFFVFIHFLANQVYKPKQILFFFLFINAFWALFDAYWDLDHYLSIGIINNLLILAFMLYSSYKKYSWLIIPVIAFNLMMQLLLFQQFITPKYVD